MDAGLLLLPGSYLLGTVPTALVVGRGAGHDPAREGSGNPGAANVYRLAGPRAGALVFAGDLAKGAVATAAGLASGGRRRAMACGWAAVLGHLFPVTRRFRGGRGVATSGGVLLVLFPTVGLAEAAVWAATARLTRRASVASLVVAATIPIGVARTRGPRWEVVAAGGLAALVAARHTRNLARLVRGEELSLGGGS